MYFFSFLYIYINFRNYARKKFSPKISHFFAFRSLEANAKISFFSRNLALICFAIKTNAKKSREIINYDIIKLLMLSSVSREFQKFFFAINCCNLEFSQIFFKFIFAKKVAKIREKGCENSRKVYEIRTKVFVRWKP